MLLDASPSYRLPKSYPVLAIYVHYASIEYSIMIEPSVSTLLLSVSTAVLSVSSGFDLSNEKAKSYLCNMK